jgi:hypothetical protein
LCVSERADGGAPVAHRSEGHPSGVRAPGSEAWIWRRPPRCQTIVLEIVLPSQGSF